MHERERPVRPETRDHFERLDVLLAAWRVTTAKGGRWSAGACATVGGTPAAVQCRKAEGKEMAALVQTSPYGP